jgi:hypothetical protein
MKNSYVTPSITQMLYGWSKWGRGNFGIFREITEEWNCQICGERQIIGLPQYFFPMDDSRRDFIRVCSSCWHDLREAGVHTYEELDSKLGIEKFKEQIRLKIIEVEAKLKTSLDDEL